MEDATAQRGQPSVFGRFTRVRNSIRARPAWLTSIVSQEKMKISFLLLALVVFASSGFARSWPEWQSSRVSEVRFRDGIPGEQIRATTDRQNIDKILQALGRARAVRKVTFFTLVFGAKKEPTLREWQVSLDVIGERPEAGRWLLNLDTGDCTFLDPLIQPVYRLLDEDRQMLKAYFRKEEKSLTLRVQL